MIRAIACFELRYQLRGPLFWVITGFLFLLTFGATATRYIVISDPSGRVLRNAPFATVHLLAMVSLFCLFLTTVFVARAILRDFHRGTAELVFSRPVPRLQFLVVILFAMIGILTTIGVQAFYGYYHFELLVYGQGLVFMTLGYGLLCVLASFVQVVAEETVLYLDQRHVTESGTPDLPPASPRNSGLCLR